MDYIIETDFEGPGFVAVPNQVAQAGVLTPEALGLLVYFASLPRGYVLRVAQVREVFSMGKDKWQRIARELREVGALSSARIRDKAGRVLGERVSVRWPDFTGSRETRLPDREPGNPAAGKPAKHCRKTRQTLPENPAPYKKETKKQSARQVVNRPRSEHGRSPHESGGHERYESEQARPDEASELTPFQRTLLREEKSLVIGGQLVKAGTARHEALRKAQRIELRAS